MRRPELNPLTSVRGLFAWMVVLYHLRLACAGWLEPGVVAVLAKGYLAVDFFFLLSGFVIWLNYGERLGRRGAGTATGLIDGFVYFGTALQDIVYGSLLPEKGTAAAKVVDNWYAWPIAMLPVAVVGIALSLTVWNARVGAKSAAH